MCKNWLKRLVGRILCPLLCAVLLLGPLAGSAHAVSTAKAQLRPDYTIVIDGTTRTFYNASGQQVHPIVCDGTTYLPVRAIGELMGKNVDWNESTKTVTLAGTRTTASVSGTPDGKASVQNISIELRSDFTVNVDGTVRTFADANGRTVYPALYNGSTYLPVRAIGELMGKSVSWNAATNTVTLSGGTVTDADSFSGPDTPAAPSGQGLIGEEAAKAKALAHAGLTASEVTFTQVKLERENGTQVYDVEFYSPAAEYDSAVRTEYDYEINAVTGEIVKFDHDTESTNFPSPSENAPIITEEEARKIALAQVPGAKAEHIVKLKLDRDDGLTIYEVEIIYNGREYEIEINAADGTVLKLES